MILYFEEKEIKRGPLHGYSISVADGSIHDMQ